MSDKDLNMYVLFYNKVLAKNISKSYIPSIIFNPLKRGNHQQPLVILTHNSTCVQCDLTSCYVNRLMSRTLPDVLCKLPHLIV